mmetsp:Transcript_2044/g.6314  ORF Transcript_2044/g.6314 Transcript_2044/m.6314 type:complete len:469 (-) Transcript_2044:349-1755(-)
MVIAVTPAPSRHYLCTNIQQMQRYAHAFSISPRHSPSLSLQRVHVTRCDFVQDETQRSESHSESKYGGSRTTPAISERRSAHSEPSFGDAYAYVLITEKRGLAALKLIGSGQFDKLGNLTQLAKNRLNGSRIEQVPINLAEEGVAVGLMRDRLQASQVDAIQRFQRRDEASGLVAHAEERHEATGGGAGGILLDAHEVKARPWVLRLLSTEHTASLVIHGHRPAHLQPRCKKSPLRRLEKAARRVLDGHQPERDLVARDGQEHLFDRRAGHALLGEQRRRSLLADAFTVFHDCVRWAPKALQQVRHLHFLVERNQVVAIQLSDHIRLHFVRRGALAAEVPVRSIARCLETHALDHRVLHRDVRQRVHDPFGVVCLDHLAEALTLGLELGLGHELAVVNALRQRLQHSNVARAGRPVLAVVVVGGTVGSSAALLRAAEPVQDEVHIHQENLVVDIDAVGLERAGLGWTA